jgi:hypothetical protein
LYSAFYLFSDTARDEGHAGRLRALVAVSFFTDILASSRPAALLHRRIMNCAPDRLINFTSEVFLVDLMKLDGHFGCLLCIH